jgi:hypothetical protein
MLQVSDVNHESALYDVRLELVALSSIARTSTSVTPRCSIRNSAWLVNERSQFHHSGNVGMKAFRRPIVALGQQFPSAADTIRRATHESSISSLGSHVLGRTADAATLEDLVLASLAKKSEDRPQNARQLAQSLDTIDGMTWGEEEAGRWWGQHHPLQALAPNAITL